MTDQTTPEVDDLFAELRADLPRRMRDVFRGYDLFTAVDVPLDAKAFAAHHGAAKAALSHLDALVKVFRWAGLAGTDDADADVLAGLLDEARAALAGGNGDEP